MEAFFNDLIELRPSWATLIWLSLLLIGVYALLRILVNFLKQTQFLRGLQDLILKIIDKVLTLYEPIAVIILLGTFIMINPLYHGGIFLVPLIVGFSQVKNYLTGKLVKLDDKISAGKMIRVEGVQGVIAREGIWGIYLQTGDGVHFINYTKLMADGYTLISNEEIGKFSLLNVRPPENSSSKDELTTLMDLLTTTPYIDWNFKPELSYENRNSKNLRMKVFLRETSHLQALEKLMEERGYECLLMDRID